MVKDEGEWSFHGVVLGIGLKIFASRISSPALAGPPDPQASANGIRRRRRERTGIARSGPYGPNTKRGYRDLSPPGPGPGVMPPANCRV